MFQSSSRGVASFILYIPRPPYVPKILFDTISESIVGSTGLTYLHAAFLEETLSFSLDSPDSSLRASEVIVDIIREIDFLYISLNSSITEVITLTSSVSNIVTQLSALTETISLVQSSNDKAVYSILLSEVIRLLDLIDYGKLVSIIESIAIQDAIVNLSKFSNSLLESLSVTPTVIPTSIRLISLSETFNLNSLTSQSSILKERVIDSFIISLPTSSGQDNYLAYLLSPETMSVSNYINYNFDGCTKFKDKYLFFNSTGLYEYGGKRDDGESYKSYIETIAFNFGSSNIKQVPSIYLGHTCSGATYLKVKTDGKREVHYKLNKRTENLHTQKVDIGKGLLSRYFQFELVTDADDFSVESIDFYPLELRRKL